MEVIDEVAPEALPETHAPPTSSIEHKPVSIDEVLQFLRPSARTMLFIDGANTYRASRSLGFDIDYKSLRQIFADRCDLVRAYYFTGVPDASESRSYTALRPLVDWMAYNKYTTITKTVKQYADGTTESGQPRWKGNMDVELTITFMQQLPHVDTIVLFSGDGDFTKLVETGKEHGKRVIVISALDAKPAMLSDELRRAADEFVDLQALVPAIARRVTARPRRTRYSEVVVQPQAGKELPVSD